MGRSLKDAMSFRISSVKVPGTADAPVCTKPVWHVSSRLMDWNFAVLETNVDIFTFIELCRNDEYYLR